ncbi:hypothetical protein MMC34_006937 [Xylographa carneopallida]|nr:hypothetical protein [Xylographa carneopallida]
MSSIPFHLPRLAQRQKTEKPTTMKLLLPFLLLSLSSLSLAATQLTLPPLQFSVYHTDLIPVHYPPYANLTWSPISITLIHSATSAVLVDAPLTASQTHSLIAWIRATIPSKALTTLYITHGHGDHFFGIPLLRAAFPGLRILATAPTIQHIQETLSPPQLALWEGLFPGQIPAQDDTLSLLHALPPHDLAFHLDGHPLRAVPLGETDTWNSTVLHMPALGLVVAGDAVYGHYYQYLGDSNTTALQDEWLAALDAVAALKPQAVVPGHMMPGEGYGVGHLQTTEAYLRAWREEVAKATTREELVDAVQGRFPDRMGEFILRFSASMYSKF